jgi:hypothetical protein
LISDPTRPTGKLLEVFICSFFKYIENDVLPL